MSDAVDAAWRAEDFFTEAFAPPVAKLLGWRLERADPEAGAIAVSFEGRAEFANPAGDIQGGILAAMLDDAMGPAVVVKSRGQAYAPTINLNVQFLRPVKPGRILCEGRCVQLGRTIAYLEGKLYAADGTLAATASASARVTTFEKARRG